MSLISFDTERHDNRDDEENEENTGYGDGELGDQGHGGVVGTTRTMHLTFSSPKRKRKQKL